MRKEQIISKGKYTRQQPEGLIGAKQYLFIRDENGMKRLLLRFSNNRNEFCSKFAFVVYQLDVKGNVLGQERLESAGGGFGPKAIFAFDQKIEVEERCTDIIVQLVYARYGNYTYHVENEEISVTYSDKNS